MSVTLVSCYYEIPSKRPIQQYHEWIENFMKLSCNMVIFTDKKSSEWLFEKFPENERRNYVLLEIDDFKTSQWDYKRDEKLDHEMCVGHSEKLYKVWNEKPFFLQKALELNYYQTGSLDHFVWCDIGCFRNTSMMKYFKTFPSSNKLHVSKIQMLQIADFTEDDKNNVYDLDERFKLTNRIGGTMFSVPTNLIATLCQIHENIIDQFDKKTLFKGKDQSLYAFEVLQNPDLFDLVKPVFPEYFHYDVWFYFHYLWSDWTRQERLKIAIIGPGLTPIPPTGWGAVEILIWDYAQELKKLGHEVSIINTPRENEIVSQVDEVKPDVVHIQYDNHFNVCEKIYKKAKIVGCTSHFGYLDQLNRWGYHNYLQTFIRGIKQMHHPNIYAFVLSKSIKNIYKKFEAHDNKIIITPNGANDTLFKYNEEPLYPDRSIYLAKIDYRKRQFYFQKIPSLYFAGNIADTLFNPSINYLGEWSKDTLYSELTNYGNLVLLSNGEADPLVVKEALIAGLGVVISEYSTAGLDLSKEFITVIPESKIKDLKFVESEIIKNREYSIKNRQEIREYGLSFSWSIIVKKYEEMLYFLLQ